MSQRAGLGETLLRPSGSRLVLSGYGVVGFVEPISSHTMYLNLQVVPPCTYRGYTLAALAPKLIYGKP